MTNYTPEEWNVAMGGEPAKTPPRVKLTRGEPVSLMVEGHEALQVLHNGERFSLKGESVDDVHDGFHTFGELYEFRMLYHAHAAQGWIAEGIEVVKSWKHHDGQPCFDGGWFIVHAELPSGQVTNHYREQYWDLFDVPEVELPPVWDGHTAADVVNRLVTYLRMQ